MATDSDELVVIGKITTVFGVKGWVKIHSFTEPAENFRHYTQYYIARAHHWQPVVFDQIQTHGKGLVGLIKNVSDREQARNYCQHNIAVPAVDMAPLADGEYYWHQLEGLHVCTCDPGGEQRLLGILDYMMATGANDVLVVKPTKDSVDKRERLIPWLPDQVVKDIDIKAGVIRVDWDPEF